MIRVCLTGMGKTGREIASEVMEQKDMKLVAAVCGPNSEKKGRDVGALLGRTQTGIMIDSSDNLEEIIFKTKPDIVIDFSAPEASIRNARVFSRMKVNMVIATTGFSAFSLKRLYVLSKKYHTGILYAPNITLGVNVLMLLTNLASNMLNNYDFRITEMHHKKKKDAPSGTAVKIAREVKRGIKASGVSDNSGEVPITAIRAGGIIGKHEVLIVGEEDKIEISHESFSRKAFAQGAMRAARFLFKKSGYYEMSDVLDLDRVLGSYLESQKKPAVKKNKSVSG